MDTATVKHLMQPTAGIQSSNIYRSTISLPLRLFIQCLIHKNYDALNVSGKASEAELIKAWNEIDSQYTEHLAGPKGRKLLEVQAELVLMMGKLRVIEMIVNVLSNCTDDTLKEAKDLGKVLNRMCRTDFTFDDEDKFEELQRCLDRSKSLKTNIQLKEIELDTMSNLLKKKGVGKKITEEWFYDTLITLSDHAKVLLNDNILTYDFCERILRYDAYCKAVKR